MIINHPHFPGILFQILGGQCHQPGFADDKPVLGNSVPYNTIEVQSRFTFKPMIPFKTQKTQQPVNWEPAWTFPPFCSTLSVYIPLIPVTEVRLPCFIVKTWAVCKQYGSPCWSAVVMWEWACVLYYDTFSYSPGHAFLTYDLLLISLRMIVDIKRGLQGGETRENKSWGKHRASLVYRPL